MEELEITLGQRALPSVHGEQTTASAYAGLGARHVLVLADGAAGEVPSRLAAQTAATAALAKIRSSVLPDLVATLEDAIAEAHQAVRRVLMGSPTEGKAAAAILIVVVDAGGVVAARVGSGRVYLLRGDRLAAMYTSATPEGLGVGAVEPEIITSQAELGPGTRILVLSESALRPLAADLERLGQGGPAQLAASRLADAARRRGQLDPLAVHVIEVAGDGPRAGPHPALARIARDRPRTYDPEGRQLGRRALASEHDLPRPRRERGGLVVWFGLATLFGVGAAFAVHGGRDAPGTAAPKVPVVVIEQPAPPSVPPPPTPEVLEAVEPAPAPVDPEVAALLDAEGAGRTAKNIRNYITKRFPEDGEAVFTRLEAGILARGRDPKMIEALLELMRESGLKRTTRWVQELLPRLYSDDPTQGGARPAARDERGDAGDIDGPREPEGRAPREVPPERPPREGEQPTPAEPPTEPQPAPEDLELPPAARPPTEDPPADDAPPGRALTPEEDGAARPGVLAPPP